MNINYYLEEKGMTKYRLSKLSGVPYATLNDLFSGKTRIEKCSAETLYKISKLLGRLDEELAFYNEQRTKILEQYCDIVGNQLHYCLTHSCLRGDSLQAFKNQGMMGH